MSEPTWMVLPPARHLCQVCAVDHDPASPHNPASLYYATTFNIEHGRGPTWADAMAHCSDEVRAAWTEELAKHGVIV